MEKAKKITKNRHRLYLLSFLTVGCLIGSFAYPLQKFQIRQQREIGAFKSSYNKVYIFTENDREYPYGYQENRSEVIAKIQNDYKVTKIVLLAASIMSGAIVMLIGDEIVDNLEIDKKVEEIDKNARIQLLADRVKNKYALADKAEQLLFRETLRELVNLSGVDSTQEATELNESKLAEIFYMQQEGHSLEFAIKQKFGIDPDNPEFQNVLFRYSEEYGEE
jgi:hypothetical protein